MLSADGKTSLIIDSDKAYCPNSKRYFKKNLNVIDFLESEDTFYEGAYLNTVNYLGNSNPIINKIMIWTINSGYLNEIEKHVPIGSNILELGCAGGIRYLGNNYKTYGCDLSKQSLEIAGKHYVSCVAADSVKHLPFLENSFDAVISSYFWEHLDNNQKIKCLKNIKRVLKPGGVIIFLYDVQTKNPFISFFKKLNPKNYKEKFIDNDGHIGYEKLKNNLQTFSDNDFQVIESRGLQKTMFQEPSVYLKFLGVGGFFSNGLLKFLLILSQGKLTKPYLFFLRIIDSMFFFLPSSWSRITMTTAKVKK